MTISEYHSPLKRMLYDSPLHTFVGKVIFAAILLVIVSLAVKIWVGWLTPLFGGWLILAFGLAAFVGSLPGLIFIRYLDRREPEDASYYAGVLLSAAILTPALGAYFNSISPFSLLTVGLNEEFCKAIPLLLLVFFAPTMVNGVRDGIIYGALGGFGFNIIEIANYVLRVSYPAEGLEGSFSQLSRLGWLGIGNHVIWSMLVGAGIGLAVQARKRRTRILAAGGGICSLPSPIHCKI